MIVMTNKKGKEIHLEVNFYTGKPWNTAEDFHKMWGSILDYYYENAENDMAIVLIDEETILAGQIYNGDAQKKPDVIKIIRE